MWKQYRGGDTTPIWLATLSNSKVEKIPRNNSNDFNPMWIGEKVFFLSDRDGAGGIVDRRGNLDRGIEAVEQRMIVSQLLESLPDRERDIVVLRFYEGLTQSEIADRFGVSQMQISRILARTLDRLRAGAGDVLA